MATGARPRSLPNLEIDGKVIITTREALALKSLPKAIGIIGAGAIGVEFAYLFNAYGVEVTIFEAQDHLVPNEDESISQELEKIFKAQGIKFELSAKVLNTKGNDGGIEIEYEINGEQKNYSAETDFFALILIILFKTILNKFSHQYLNAKKVGVNNNVSIVAKPSPKTIAVANCFHHVTVGSFIL